MAYDEALAERVREVVGVRPAVSERKMFGALAWFVGGNMACGVVGEELLVRLDPADADWALAEPHVSQFSPAGRSMRGLILIEAPGIASDEDLAKWVDCGAEHAASLPPK
ncbi:MAG TPA: TfoX/Sxy family protein [Solirubrobacteraceae bacterium]